jgi:hypothetical protein
VFLLVPFDPLFQTHESKKINSQPTLKEYQA